MRIPGTRVAALCALCVSSCSPRAPQWHQEAGYRWRELSVSRRGQDGFRGMPPAETGITFANRVTEAQILENEHVLNGSGVAIGDANGDGLADVYLARLHGPNALYRNLGGWRFEDVAEPVGIAAADRFSTGAAFADVDGDGDLDLLVTSLGGTNSLFVNDGTGRFSERTDAGLASHLGSTTIALADTDGDGDLDLYVANYKVRSVRDIYSPQIRAFDQVVRQVGGRYEVKPEFREHYGLVMQKDRLMRFEYGEPDKFYRNDGTGHFVEVSFTGGAFLDEAGRPLAAAPADWSLAARFSDIDGDGDPDLYVCNDFESPDLLWINDGAGRFRLAGSLSLRTTSQSAMAVDFSDVDRDGDLDFLEVDMLDPDTGRRKTQTPPVAPEQLGTGDIEARVQQPRNTLFINRGDGTFADAAYYAGIQASGWSWSALFLDVDLDGYEDVLIGTGHAYDFLDSDTQNRIQTSRIGTEWRETRLLFPKLDLPNLAFRNRGDLTFEPRGQRWGFGLEADVSHGMASGDLDGDGDLDVVINRLGRPAAAYRNEGRRPRVAVRLIGRAPNTQGVGAKIRLHGGPVPEQTKEVTVGGLYLSSAEPLYTFAAGGGQGLSLSVEWRSGASSTVQAVGPNRLYEIEEPAPAAPPHAVVDILRTEEPYFADLSAQLNHTHHEEDYNDFGRQPLLLNRLSELGPGVTWHDVDGDGDEDLLVTTGRGGSLALYWNERGRLVPAPLRVDRAPLDQTAVLALPDGKGGTSLLLGQMNYEAESPAAARAADAVIRLDLSAAARASTAVPGTESSTGPLALADYDADGDLDLFVGGRVVPARYPAPASSRLFTNVAGRFAPDTANDAQLSAVGLVSSAVFSDIDGDGDPDLLLALEWGPIKVLVNTGGRFSDATGAYRLDRFSSRWNGITTGDFNEDGLPDIVATSWGRNTRLRPDSAHPVMVYYADFDANGTMDLVDAQYDARLKAVAPLRGFLGVTMGIPDVGRRIGSFRAYADASVQEVLGPAAGKAAVLQANGLAHQLFLSREGGFVAVELPGEAQLAPAFHVGVADFNGDGHDDLFLAQNFFSTEVGTRYDAGRGLWLSGDGRGGLAPVAGSVSGVKVYGDQRGAALADFDADGRVDLVVSQNANRTVLYHNRGGTPGLRVRLVGPAENPDAFGATIRLVYGAERGPAREVHAGSGYWSQDGPVQVLGMRQRPTAVWVRWPDGKEATVAVPEGARELVAKAAAR